MTIKSYKPMPIVEFIDRINRNYGAADEYGNKETATTKIREQDRQKKAPVKKGPRMSATRSWQIIKESMSKDELEEFYKDHPEERPIEVTPFKPDPYLTHVLGNDWLLDWERR